MLLGQSPHDAQEGSGLASEAEKKTKAQKLTDGTSIKQEKWKAKRTVRSQQMVTRRLPSAKSRASGCSPLQQITGKLENFIAPMLTFCSKRKKEIK